MIHLDNFLTLLEGVTQTASGWKANCPCPDHGGGAGDRTPSLTVGVGDESKILFHCFAGCTPDAILDGMGIDYTALYPADGDNSEGHPAAVRSKPGAAESPALVNAVYADMLARLSLTEGHRDLLSRRGLDNAWIDRAEYRSLDFFRFRQEAVTPLRDKYGADLLSVPGFVTKAGKVTAADLPNGLLIPVRAVGGAIRGLQIRVDQDGAGGKYRWFSGGGATSGTPAHVPVGVGRADVVRLTEGPLKADIAYALDGTPTIGCAGVTTWPAAVPDLVAIAAKTVRLAFDADAQTKPSVATALAACYWALKGGGHAV